MVEAFTAFRPSGEVPENHRFEGENCLMGMLQFFARGIAYTSCTTRRCQRPPRSHRQVAAFTDP
jgi:hypothetical protein